MINTIATLPELSRTVWALDPVCLTGLLTHAKINEPTPYAPADPEQYEARAARLPSSSGSIAVLPIRGILSHRGFGGLLGMLFGGTQLDEFGKVFDMVIAEKGVGAVVLDIDSPGGSVMGMTEAAAKIRAGREVKHVVAVANCMALSGGYYLGSAASQLIVSPSGMVGSVGVYREHTDYSAAEEAAGIKTTFISAGEHKTENMEPLTDDSRAAIQSQVDTYYEQFVADVAKGRGTTARTVKDTYGKGRSITAANALSAGMVDRVATLEEVIRVMSRSKTPRSDAANRRMRMMDL